MPTISVIIPTRNGNDSLRVCLGALARDFPAEAETIVVSDGGQTDLGTLLADFLTPLRLTCLHVQHGGPAYARNRGLEIARGEIAVFTDDDCSPRPGWLTAITAGVSSSPAVATGGITFNGVPANSYADAAQVVLDLVALHELESCGEVRFFPANNCAFPIAPLRQLKGFDESYHTSEDRDLLRRWRAAGNRVAMAKDAVVDHNSAPDLLGYVRKFYGYGRGAAHFHATSNGGSYRDSASFHVRLPTMLAPVLKGRGLRRRASLVGLLAVWEMANLVGFAAEWSRSVFRSNGRSA